MRRIPIIHIGMPKTATKTFQWRLFAHHSEIYYLGRYDGYPFKGKYREFDKCRDSNVQAIMKQIAYEDIYDPDIGDCRQRMELPLSEAEAQNLVPVWSWESYATGSLAERKARAKNLKQVFGEARIIMTLRNPLKLLESAYFQQLKRDNIGARAFRGSPPYAPGIERWLADGWAGEILPHLQYAETLQAYVDQFGRDNVHVLLFEDLIEDSDTFFRNVCGVIGIEADEGIQLMSDQSDNERWTESQLEKLRAIKASPIRSLRFRLARRKDRRAMLGLKLNSVPIAPGPKAKAPISPKWQERVYDQTRSGHRWIEKVFGLDLEGRGYLGGQP